MAKSAASAVSLDLKRFRVVLRGYPVMGFVDRLESGDIKVHPFLPVEPHYRPRDASVALDEGIDDGWYTARQLEELYGLKEIPAGWKKRNRLRSDLTGALFEGAVFEAYNEHDARAQFRSTYGVNSTSDSLWTVSETTEPVGAFGPKKIRGLLARQA